MFIMGGNLAMGLIIFSVLIIVNFLVITKGAGRMAEVGARFALDAMPGKQMAIDADVAAGAISHENAKKMRAEDQQETAFLGSLDGASKFVKGDAIAGLLITLLNLVAGIAVGLMVHKLSFGEAIENYSVLTVGDGLVSQIPAVIISVSAALLLSKGKNEGAVDFALFRELGLRPEALATVGAVILVFGLFPGMPLLPFMSGSLILFGLAWRATKTRPPDETPLEDVPVLPAKENFGDLFDVDEIHIELSPDLIRSLIDMEGGLDARVERIRRYVIQEFGFIMPPVRVTDKPSLGAGEYGISIHGVCVAKNTLKPGQYLALISEDAYPAILGENVLEPVYGASARWVDKLGRERLLVDGTTVVDPVEILSTHLLEVIQTEFARLFTRRGLREILDAFCKPSQPDRAEANRRLLDEFIPEKVSYDLAQFVMRELLSERISVRSVAIILEAIAEGKGMDLSSEGITEHVRRRLAFQFLPKLKDETGKLPVIQLSDKWSEIGLRPTDAEGQSSGPSPASLVAAIRDALQRFSSNGGALSIAAPSRSRRSIRAILASYGIKNTVLSFDEIATTVTPNVLSTV